MNCFDCHAIPTIYTPGAERAGHCFIILDILKVKTTIQSFLCKDNSNYFHLQHFLMPSTRRQKAKARKSREMDMMTDIDNLDVMLGGGNENPIERELADAIEQSSVQGDYEANEYQRDNFRIFTQESETLRQNEARHSSENFTSEFNLRLSQEMDSMMSMVHSQINSNQHCYIRESDPRNLKHCQFNVIFREQGH